jgi:hypothetical protein
MAVQFTVVKTNHAVAAGGFLLAKCGVPHNFKNIGATRPDGRDRDARGLGGFSARSAPGSPAVRRRPTHPGDIRSYSTSLEVWPGDFLPHE